MHGTSYQQIVVLHRVTRSTIYDCTSDRVRRGASSIPDLFSEAPTVNAIEKVNDSNNPVDSIESFNGAQPSLSNLPANTEAINSLDGISNLPVKTEAIKSPNRAQPSTTNLPANTEAMSNTQHTNPLSVTNKENISNKSGHSTTILS